MFTPHIFILVTIFLFHCNKEIEASTSSMSSVATTSAKVHRSQTMKASSLARSPSPRTHSRTSSTSSVSSQATQLNAMKEIELQPIIDTLRSEVTAQTFSGGHINPRIHSVQARLRTVLLRDSVRFRDWYRCWCRICSCRKVSYR